MPDVTINLDGLSQAPYLEQYFGAWCVLEDQFLAMVDRVGRMDLRAHIDARREEPIPQAEAASRPFTTVTGGRKGGKVAVIQLHGAMMKQRSSLSNNTSTVEARRAIRAAVADEEIDAILLHIDSPGGTAAGTADLADDVAAAAKQKTTWAYIEDLGASAAYWVASQATKVFAGRAALVGSIGTYAVIYDASGMAAMEGVKVHVIRAGKFKGAGAAGTEITAEQLAEFQRTVDALNEHFLQAVSAGRKLSMERVLELADGRVHIAAEAHRLGLIDGVQSLDETIAGLVGRSNSNKAGARAAAQEETVVMSEPAKDGNVTPAAPKAATAAELKQAFPNADAEFRLSCLEKGMSIAEAKDAWMDTLQARLENRERELAEAKAAKQAEPAPAAKKPGVEPLSDKSGGAASAVDGDPIAAFHEAVQAKVRAGMTRQKATIAVAKENKELHAEYVAAYNAQHGRRSTI